MSELVDLLVFAPWRALAQVAATGLAVLGGAVAAGYGLAWWMRVDDPNRDEETTR